MSAKFPQGDLNIFRHILRKDNELADLLHQVTYVTAFGIRHFATNLQIYESFQKANKFQTMKDNHRLQIFLTIFTLVLIPNFHLKTR